MKKNKSNSFKGSWIASRNLISSSEISKINASKINKKDESKTIKSIENDSKSKSIYLYSIIE